MNTKELKEEIMQLMKLHENGKPGYSCGFIDACFIILGMIDRKEKSHEKQKHMDNKETRESLV